MGEQTGCTKNCESTAPSRASESIAGVVAGQVQVNMTAVGPALPYIKSKSVIPLAVTGPKRTRTLPDVPTLVESGYPDLDQIAWDGLFAPAGTPNDVIDKIYRDVATVLKMPEIASQLQDLGYDVDPITPDAFAKFLAHDIEEAGKIIKAAGIKAE